ncbi:hypothetical protein DPMN_058597 [Dreissena polymorpha]|uniref:Uncharacterized protein n=1 Tax=Dreissena polymorpha TaxID=45954 RepID=A0A9D4C219_DREPO|nr:hypothetical protein DPMN_058597 [Dreissena polymorpha]
MSNRWVAALSNYDYTITNRKGSSHLDVDGLIRCIPKKVIDAVSQAAAAETVPLSETIRNPEVVLPSQHMDVPAKLLNAHILSFTVWRKAQGQDEIISTVINHLTHGAKPAKPMDRRLIPFLTDWSNLTVLQSVEYRKTSVDYDER